MRLMEFQNKGDDNMGISMIGSIGSYLKNMELKQTWQLRKENGYVKGKMSLEDWMKKQEEKIGFRPPEPQNYTMSAIENKVRAGKSLTPKERKYLEAHNSELLKKADENEATRKNFEKELKECRTKEDVQRLRMKYLNASVTKLHAVIHNPNIPESKKLEIAWEENGKVMATQEALGEFIKKGGYEKLPTEAEKTMVEKQENEREEVELHPSHQENTEHTEAIENADQKKEHIKSPETMEANPIPYQTSKQAEVTIPFVQDTDVDIFTVQKVKRAKAAAVYAANTSGINPFASFGIETQTSLVDKTI